MSCTRLLFTFQLLYYIEKTNINILNLTFIMRKKAIRITRFLRNSIADTFLETRPAWISFSQGSFCFFKFFSRSFSYRATCDLLFLSYGGYWRWGQNGHKKIILLKLYLITAIRHHLGVNLSCVVAFHMLKTMFLLSIIKTLK